MLLGLQLCMALILVGAWEAPTCWFQTLMGCFEHQLVWCFKHQLGLLQGSGRCVLACRGGPPREGRSA